MLWFRRMKECNGDYFVMYAFFNFKPVKEFKSGSIIWKCLGVRMIASSQKYLVAANCR